MAQDKQTVAGMLSQTQQAASEAVLSAQAAKLSETAAVQAQTGAEAAEDTARQYAEDTGADRQAVANDKQAVSQMREDVAADRQAVEQTAAQFGQTSQDALTAIGQAQSTAVGAVKAEGNKQTTAVQEAGTQAVKEVAEAKTTAVQVVTTEGDKQTKRVEDAAAGIVADREQIGQNKTDIAGLVEGMTDLAPAIHNTASGSVITADDAAEGRPFWGLRVFGKSTQRTTTGAQLLSIKQEDVANKDGLSAKVNVDGGITVTGTPDKQYATIYGKDIILSPGKYYLNGGNGSAGAVLLKARITFSDGSSKNCANGSFEVTPDTKSVSILIQYESATIQSVNYTIYPMLNKGETALPFEPYTGGKPSPSPEYPQEIVGVGEGGSIAVGVTGKNLLTGRLYFTNYSNGIPHVYNEDEVALPYAPSSETHGIGYVVPCKPGVQYTFSVTNPNKNWYLGIAEYENFEQAKSFLNKIGFQQGTEKSSIKYTAVGNGVLVCAIAGKWTDGKTTTHECTESELLQLEIGSEATTYEPYRAPQTLTLQTPNGLPGVPVSEDGNYTDADGQQWVCDEIDLERGKYVQRIKKSLVLLKKTSHGNPDGYRYISYDVNDMHRNHTEILSDKFRYNKGAANSSGDITIRGIRVSPDFNAIVAFEKSVLPSELIETTVYYVLATPIERDLTPEEIAAYKALRTYGPTTVISNDAGAEMEVTYVADTKAYIRNLEERLNAKMVNIQSALISQKTSGGGGI